jgi:uncharacterized membrane protein
MGAKWFLARGLVAGAIVGAILGIFGGRDSAEFLGIIGSIIGLSMGIWLDSRPHNR